MEQLTKKQIVENYLNLLMIESSVIEKELENSNIEQELRDGFLLVQKHLQAELGFVQFRLQYLENPLNAATTVEVVSDDTVLDTMETH